MASFGNRHWLWLAHRKHPRQDLAQATLPNWSSATPFFQTALESLPVADRGALRAEHTAFLRYRIEDAVCRGDLVLASTLLDRVETVIGAGSTATAHLRLVLDHRLNVPSHEKAFALIERDPEAARATWLERLKLYPGELASREHLACLAWTRGYDAVRRADGSWSLAGTKNERDKAKQSEEDNTRDYEAAIAYFVEGLDYFRQLYEDESYWQVLRSKGRLLANPANPFNEVEFDAWKNSALKEQAGILVHFAVHAANQDKKSGAARAKSALARLRSCGLPREQWMPWWPALPERLLDRSPNPRSHPFEPAMARAERDIAYGSGQHKSFGVRRTRPHLPC